jgi:hypothetical protein
MNCWHCGDDVAPGRWALGKRLCLWCGEENARAERAGWCVIQEYGKGPYQLVTPAAAAAVLRGTNQKVQR